MKHIIQQQISISDKLFIVLEQSAIKRSVAKNTLLFHAGKTNKKFLFLEQGLTRAYRLINGQEYTHYFFTENWFATDFKSYLTEQPIELYLEALTDVVLST